MATIASLGGRNMIYGLATGGGPVVTGNTVVDKSGVIDSPKCRDPSYAAMAGIALSGSTHMGRMFSSGD